MGDAQKSLDRLQIEDQAGFWVDGGELEADFHQAFAGKYRAVFVQLGGLNY